jgi:hypothetical protein
MFPEALTYYLPCKAKVSRYTTQGDQQVAERTKQRSCVLSQTPWFKANAKAIAMSLFREPNVARK